MAETLKSNITENGVDQGDAVRFFKNVRDLCNELQADHATNKTTLDECRTAIIELIDDHDTNQTHMTNLKTLANQLRTSQLYQCLGNPAFAIDTNFDVKNANAISYLNGGTLKTLGANTNFDTGTSATLAASQWGAAMLTVDSSGNGVVTWFTAAGAGYASEAAAIAAMTAPAATDTPMGYVTVQAHASGFTAGTDALTTGTGGNVATSTTYYNSINGNALVIGAAVSTSSEAALTAGDPTASAAALTNSTSLTLTKG